MNGLGPWAKGNTRTMIEISGINDRDDRNRVNEKMNGPWMKVGRKRINEMDVMKVQGGGNELLENGSEATLNAIMKVVERAQKKNVRVAVTSLFRRPACNEYERLHKEVNRDLCKKIHVMKAQSVWKLEVCSSIMDLDSLIQARCFSGDGVYLSQEGETNLSEFNLLDQGNPSPLGSFDRMASLASISSRKLESLKSIWILHRQMEKSLHSSCTNRDKISTGLQAKYFPAKKTPMLPAGTFNGKTAFVTGGGTGLGKGMATMLSSLGANVVIAARRLSVLEETAKNIKHETKGDVLAVAVDIRQSDSVAAALDACEQRFGLPNIIINNAAGNFISPTERLSSNAWRTITDIVLNGTANVTIDAGRRLIKAKQGGAFLNITTTYTRSGTGFVCPSAAAKAGVETMSKSLNSEWGRYGLRFNCLAPGPVETEGAFSRLDPSGKFTNEAHKRIPAGRLGEVEEIANLATFLVSDYASWIGGESIAIDGGCYPYLGGEMNILDRVTPDEWDMLEKIIRANNKQDKQK
ncbi:NAD(P)-binding domain [Trinorchestia longiramus]|nr:NAD(P)-binding domain [Trinorchestia longiramus]